MAITVLSPDLLMGSAQDSLDRVGEATWHARYVDRRCPPIMHVAESHRTPACRTEPRDGEKARPKFERTNE